MRVLFNLFLVLSSLLTLGACSDSSDAGPADVLPAYDFSAVDARLQNFIDESDQTEGISITLVDREQGTVHEAALGDHPENIIVLLASVSKLATVSLMMAIDEDASVNFDIDTPIAEYLPWDGVYGEPNTAQLLSNTSGIPGGWLNDIGLYGVHECQYDPDFDFEECARLIYTNELPGSSAPGTVFDYGGSQWQLAGAVAMQVTNSDWHQLFEEYVGGPCDLEVYRYGNMEGREYEFTGDPDSLGGTGNVQPGKGAIASMRDMAKLLLMHIRQGACGDKRVLSPSAVTEMQVNRIDGLANPLLPGRTYGMAWFGREDLPPTVIYDPGGFGSIAWLDTERMIGGYIAIDDYSTLSLVDTQNLTLYEIIPLVGRIVDEARLGAAP